MAATLAATFTLISVFEDDYEDIWNPVRSVVGETLNCEREVKTNPQDLYVVGLWKYGTAIGHVQHVISCICTLFFNTEA